MEQFIYGFLFGIGLMVLIAVVIARNKTAAYKMLNKTHDFVEGIDKRKSDKKNERTK